MLLCFGHSTQHLLYLQLNENLKFCSFDNLSIFPISIMVSFDAMFITMLDSFKAIRAIVIVTTLIRTKRKYEADENVL